MNKNENTAVSLEILLLNDLLSTNSIDQEIYEKALEKITAMNNTQTYEQATA